MPTFVSRNMACLAIIGKQLSDEKIASINQSEELVSYFAQYEASVISGMNKPIEFGDGSYSSPTFNADGSVKSPGVARVSYTEAIAPRSEGIINHLSHELGHAVDRAVMDEYFYSIIGDTSLTKSEKAAAIVNNCLLAEASAYIHEYIVSNEIYGATGNYSQNTFHRTLVENAIAQTVALYPGLSGQQLIDQATKVFAQNIAESLPNRMDQCGKWIDSLSDGRDLRDLLGLRVDLASDNSSAATIDSFRFGLEDPTTKTVDFLNTVFGDIFTVDRVSLEGISVANIVTSVIQNNSSVVNTIPVNDISTISITRYDPLSDTLTETEISGNGAISSTINGVVQPTVLGGPSNSNEPPAPTEPASPVPFGQCLDPQYQIETLDTQLGITVPGLGTIFAPTEAPYTIPADPPSGGNGGTTGTEGGAGTGSGSGYQGVGTSPASGSGETGGSGYQGVGTSPASGGGTTPAGDSGDSGDSGDPIVLDLNGDGVHLIEKGTVRFNMHNQTGTTASTGWVSPQDGLLVMDINHDGKIDSSRELMSEFFNAAPTQLGQSPIPSFANGWAALQYLDSTALRGNHDGVLDSRDLAFENLSVWQDSNSNGVTDAGEVKTLAELGITSISTQASDPNTYANGEQTLLGLATFTQNGRTHQMADVLFDTSSNGSRVTTVGNVIQVDTAAGSQALFAQSATTLDISTLTGTGQKYAYGSGNDDTIIGGAGNDILITGGGNDIVDAGSGNDTLFLTSAESAQNVDLGEGADTLVVTGNQDAILNLGSSHAEIAYGGTGNDLIVGGGTTALYIDGGAGSDIVTGSSANDHLIGGDGNDRLFGLNGDDTLEGGTGDDFLDGGDGNNALIGGDGCNVLEVDDGNNIIYAGNGNNVVKTGEGDNSISLGDGDNYVMSGSGVNTLTLGHGNNVIAIGSGNNVILVGSGDNIVVVGDGADVITAGNGDNTLVTGLGVNTLNAGTGNNTFVINNAADVVNVQAGGLNTIQTSVSYTASTNVQNLTGTGTANLVLSGNALDNHITGNVGNNLIDGGTGADALAGGLGDDTYVVDNMGDIVNEVADGGIDTVQSGIDYTLGANLENLTLTGTATVGTGNELDNTLIANDLGNTLSGGEGNDALHGGTGDDRLDGGTGADAMVGGAGNDTYVVDHIGDQVGESLLGGNDSVLSSITYVLPDPVENLTLTGTDNLDGTGNALNNHLQGNVGANTLDGDLGADTMAGDAGDDLYIVDHAGDLVVENADAGTDTVKASVDYTLTANVENLVLTGNARQGSGNELDNVITANDLGNLLAGAGGNDTLIGGTGDDTLDGGIGNDRMTGGHGDDLLLGGAGDDSYFYAKGDGLDRIVDTAGADSFVMGPGMTLDHIAVRVFQQTDGSYQAQLRLLDDKGCEIAVEGANFTVTQQADGSWLSPVERFVFADGSVNSFNDVLIKIVDWQFGNTQQTIRTGRDDDIIHVGNHPNTVYSGTGNDLIYTGNSGDYANGEGGLDYLVGGNGNDTLDGACGIDVMVGGNGRDVLRDGGENSAFLGGQGDDRIYGSDGSDFVAGGKQRDEIRLGTGNNVVAFNRQDGDDIVFTAESRGNNTLSLGGGIQYADLQFQKSSQDLVLQFKGGDSITLKDWYASAANHDFVTLQMIEAAAKDYRPGGSDVLRNDAVEQFDFLKLVEAFDEARSTTPGLTTWALTNALLDAHLDGSNTAALGGDLAYDYGTRGDLAGLNLSTAQDTLKETGFGTTNQTVHSWATSSTSSAVRLS